VGELTRLSDACVKHLTRFASALSSRCLEEIAPPLGERDERCPLTSDDVRHGVNETLIPEPLDILPMDVRPVLGAAQLVHRDNAKRADGCKHTHLRATQR